jgi:hypothetical protein
MTGAGVTAAAAVVGTIGTVATGLIFPLANGEVRFPESSCGGDPAPNILVAYASEFGTTG